ncbi:MAG: hypothetical protein U5R48_19420 [Gammaproteobacteria bacterium]|nr:hypothetical protein [Gammaproteobacteria bacterium]
MSWLAVIPSRRMAVALAINTRVWPFWRWAGVFREARGCFRRVVLDGLVGRGSHGDLVDLARFGARLDGGRSVLRLRP